MNIYTKAGDTGFSSTKNRMNIPKSSPIFAVLGTLDELNSSLGIAKSEVKADTKNIIEIIQQDIIKLSGEIAGYTTGFDYTDKTKWLEQSIDTFTKATGQFNGFILPGKNKASANLDFSRTVARRAEREIEHYSTSSMMKKDVKVYINRLSDMLFALARILELENGTVKEDNTNKQNFTPKTSIDFSNSFGEKANMLVRDVCEYARSLNLDVIAAVCDTAGNLSAFYREDNAFVASIDIAINKAFTSATLKMTTEQVYDLCKEGEGLYGLQFTNGGKIVIFGGGVPLYEKGKIVGALGVSGSTAENDTLIANWGAKHFSKE